MPADQRTIVLAKLGDEQARESLGSSVPPLLAEMPAKEWVEHLILDRESLIKCAIEVVRLVLPEWAQKQRKDTIPTRAVDAAEAYLRVGTEDARAHARVLSKGCSTSSRRTLGCEHRIAEAARAVANAAIAASDRVMREAVSQALGNTEEHVLYVWAVEGVYDRETEVRQKMAEKILSVLKADVDA